MTPRIEKQIYDKIIAMSIAGTLLSNALRELEPVHPDNCDEERVIPWSKIEELLASHHIMAYKEGGHRENQ